MGDLEVGGFLTDLAEKQSVSASTQNQALNALVFLYRELLQSTAREDGNLRSGEASEKPADRSD